MWSINKILLNLFLFIIIFLFVLFTSILLMKHTMPNFYEAAKERIKKGFKRQDETMERSKKSEVQPAPDNGKKPEKTDKKVKKDSEVVDPKTTIET